MQIAQGSAPWVNMNNINPTSYVVIKNGSLTETPGIGTVHGPSASGNYFLVPDPSETDTVGSLVFFVTSLLFTGPMTHEVVPGLPGTIAPADMDAIAAALLNLADGADVGITVRQALMIVCSVLGGNFAAPAGGVTNFRNPADTKDRVSTTLPGDGTRTMAYDFS